MIRPVLLVLVVLIVGACTTTEGTSVVGVVVEYQGDLVNVESFTVRTTDGEQIVLVPAADGEFSFPLPHLREHLATGEPVAVRYVSDGDRHVAVTVADAGS